MTLRSLAPIASLLALAFASCTRPLEVALLTKLEAGSVVGSSEVNAARLFTEDQGKRPPLLIKPFDDGWNPAQAPEAFKTALKEGYRVYVTSHPSNCALSIAEAANEAGVLTIVTGATTDLLSGRDDLILRVVPDLRQEQSWIAGELKKREAKRILVVRDTDNEAYTKSGFAHFAAALGGTPIQEIPVSVSTLDLNSLRKEMAAASYDLCYILVGSYQSRAGAIAQLCRVVNPAAGLMFTPWVKTPALLETAGGALAGALMPSHFPPQSESREVGAYSRRFYERFGYSPTAVSLQVYRALALLEQALAKGYRKPEDIKRYLLATGRFDLPFGPLELDSYGDAKAAFYLLEDIAAELR